VTYRDELEAARERADALERELAEKERALAEREKALAAKDDSIAEKDKALAAAKEDLEEAAAEIAVREKRRERDEERKASASEKAQGALDRLAAKGSKPRPTPKAPKPRPAPSPGAGQRSRMLRSVTVLGGLALNTDCFLVVIPSVAILGFFVGVGVLKLPVLIALPAGAAIPPLMSYVLIPVYAALKLAFLRRWPGTLPYRLDGYPELLGVKPRARGSKGFFAEMGHSAKLDRDFDPGGHTGLRLTLHFSKAPPENLATILRGFDPDLRENQNREDGASSLDRTFTRESPVSEVFSKSGSRRDNNDDNYQVHKWIRRCHRKVLRHLADQSLLSASISIR
jgi:hypothetical protein